LTVNVEIDAFKVNILGDFLIYCVVEFVIAKFVFGAKA